MITIWIFFGVLTWALDLLNSQKNGWLVNSIALLIYLVIWPAVLIKGAF